MDTQSSVSSLPWLWVIEALASFKQIDISVLNDLVARASGFSDNLGNNTRERFALRCLEGLFDPSHDMRDDLPSASESKIRLDLSESCEDVLRRIVSEVPTSDLRMGGPELLKWDIHPFIMHKKTCLPKCALELLKDKLVEGTHPSAALLRESSGLAVRDQNDGRTHADDGDPNPLLSRFHASGIDHQIEAGSEHFTAINSENENGKLQGDCPDKVVFPSKRGRSTSADGNLVGQFHDDSTGNGGDLYLNTKKYKVGSSSTSQAVGQDLVPVDRNEPSKSSMGRTIAHTGREGCNLGEESQGNELEGIRYSKDVHNGIFVSKRTEQAGSEHFTTLNSENENDKLQGDCPDKILFPSKRGRSTSAGGNSVGQFHDDSTGNGGDLYLNAKKLKVGSSSTSKSVGLDLVLVDRNEPSESPRGRTIAHTGREGCNLGEESQGGELEGIRYSKDVHNGNCISKRSEQISDDNDNEQHNQLEFCHNKMPRDVSNCPNQNISLNEGNGNREHCSATSNGTQQKIDADEAKDDSEDGTSSDNDGYHNEKVEVSTKKHNFLSSQCTFNEDIAPDVWTEQNICMKCNKDGQLLYCSASGCHLVVHENCLGSSASFDNGGNFLCPFCAYSQAISKYLEAKKKASLARKMLGGLIGIGCQKKNLSYSYVRKEKQKQSRQNGDPDILVNGYVNRNLREEEDRQENNNGGNENQIDKHQTKERVDCGIQTENHQIKESIEGKQQAESSVPRVNDNPSHREEEATKLNGTLCVDIEENQGGENMVKECPSVIRIEGHENQLPADQSCNVENSTFRDILTTLVSWRHEGEIKEEIIQQEVDDRPREPACKLNSDGEEISEEENDKDDVSKYEIRFRSQEKHYTYPAMTMLRRKRVAWTSEEEEVLKEGVRRFSSPEDKSIPWNKIFDFGHAVFHKYRNPMDLKDKWRNICRGSPKPK